jgi:hypothetical protein
LPLPRLASSRCKPATSSDQTTSSRMRISTSTRIRAGVIRGPPRAAAFAERHLIKDVADEARNHPGRASVDLSRKLEGADIGCDPL